jgi:hypothetical protein
VADRRELLGRRELLVSTVHQEFPVFPAFPVPPVDRGQVDPLVHRDHRERTGMTQVARATVLGYLNVQMTAAAQSINVPIYAKYRR